MRNKVIKSETFVPAFDMVKFLFFVQGVLYSKKLLAYIIVKLQCVKIIFGIENLCLMISKVMKSKSIVPTFDMVKFRFFVQGVFSSKEIAGLYYRQTSMCQNHLWHRETIADEKQSDEVKIDCVSL